MSVTITLYPEGGVWRYRVTAPDPVTGLTTETRSGNSYEDKELARTVAEQVAQEAIDAVANTERYDFPRTPDEPPSS